jgi:hypothetical protein
MELINTAGFIYIREGVMEEHELGLSSFFYGAVCLLLISRLEKGVLVEAGSRSSVSEEAVAGGTRVSLLGVFFVVLAVSLPLPSMVFTRLIVVLTLIRIEIVLFLPSSHYLLL